MPKPETEHEERMAESVRSVEETAESVQSVAELIETNVSEGIQPDLRELRIYISELDDKANIRLKRIHLVLCALFALNILILALVLA